MTMLSFLRSKKSSLPVKIFFGAIGFLLVAFFGANSSKDYGNTVQEAMTINGEVVTVKKIDYELDQQLQIMKTQYNMIELPENLSALIRGSIVEKTLKQVLLSQNAKALGIVASDEELSVSIKEEFANQGAFDADMYLNRFLPYYLDATGESFETVFRKQLAVSKIGKAFETLFKVSDNDAKDLYNLENTKFRYAVVKVSKNKPTASQDNPTEIEPQNSETVSNEPDPTAPVTATTIFAKWSKGEDVNPLLKEHKLTQRITSNLNLSQLEKVLDGDATTDELVMLAKLNTKTPFPANVIEKANAYYLVKLDAKIDSPVPDEKALETFKANQQNEMISGLENAWIESLESTAKIKKSPQI